MTKALFGELIRKGREDKGCSLRRLADRVGDVHTNSAGVDYTAAYTGLPLWRLVGCVDDDVYPAADQGIHYDDADFNDALAATGYEITLTASDGYTQTLSSSWIAHDDRFIVAFKVDGAFLNPAADGYMRFVYDDSVVLPEGARLKSVKFLSQITLGP